MLRTTIGYKTAGQDMNVLVMGCRSCGGARKHVRAAATVWVCQVCRTARCK